MTLGEKIKLQRKKHDMSQRDMAERLFVSRQAVSKWEADKGIPDIENLRQIAALFNISLDYLINDEAKDDDIMYSFREDRGERILRIILKAVLLLVILFVFGSINAYFYGWADNAGFDEAKTDAARLYTRIAEAAVAGLLAGSIIAEFTGRRLKLNAGIAALSLLCLAAAFSKRISSIITGVAGTAWIFEQAVYFAAVPGIFAAIFLFQKYHRAAGWQKRKKSAIAAVALITVAVIIFELMLSGLIGGKWESRSADDGYISNEQRAEYEAAYSRICEKYGYTLETEEYMNDSTAGYRCICDENTYVEITHQNSSFAGISASIELTMMLASEKQANDRIYDYADLLVELANRFADYSIQKKNVVSVISAGSSNDGYSPDPEYTVTVHSSDCFEDCNINYYVMKSEDVTAGSYPVIECLKIDRGNDEVNFVITPESE